MRTIKFRGRVCDYDEDRYVYGDLIRKKGLRKTEIWQIVCNCAYFYVEPESVEQFTDCYDADGKEIYEGDYLEIDFARAAKVIGDGSLIRDLETLKPAPEAQLHVEFRKARFELVWRTENGGVDTGIDLFYMDTIRKFVKVKEATTDGRAEQQCLFA